MATYANTSNPFINKDEKLDKRSSAGFLSKKDAPGMAKLSKKVHANFKPIETNLMSITESNNKTTTTNRSSPAIENEDKREDNKFNLLNFIDNDDENLAKNCELWGDKSNSCCSSEGTDDVSNEITKACESLVEMTVKLELEEKKLDDCAKKNCKQDSAGKQAKVGSNFEQDVVVNADQGEEEEDEEEDCEAIAPMENDSRQNQHIDLIKKLRLQLRDLEKYAFERGELDQVPPSVLAERQSVILDTLKERLSLKISQNEIERLGMDELRMQVDKEIHDLIDPLITKEHLLGQLKTQLTDLERYIAHLHKTIGKIHVKKNSCSCQLHGCNSPKLSTNSTKDSLFDVDENNNNSSADSNDQQANSLTTEALPKTSRLIRSLVTQLICSDIKLRESMRKEEEFTNGIGKKLESSKLNEVKLSKLDTQVKSGTQLQEKSKQVSDEAAWTLHIDRVILARDSLVNLFTLEPKYNKSSLDTTSAVDTNLVESIVRRQLVPAIRDLLSYGIVDYNSMPRSNSFVSLLFDPYYIISSLTCFPLSQAANKANGNLQSNSNDKIHVWNIVEDYYNSKNEPNFQSSSVKSLSQSFNLAPSIGGPIKITTKQALLIAIEDIIETLSKCKPNGPESHFRSFIYTALNKGKLSTWLRLIFKNKTVNRNFYYNFSFVSQNDKLDKFISILEVLNQYKFNLLTDMESIEQFVSAF